MLFFNKEKVEDKISTTLYDLTHLEINTIIKDEMTATKAPSSARLLLDSLARTYYKKLILLGEKYVEFLGPLPENTRNLFRGVEINLGSGYESFHELGDRAKSAAQMLKDNRGKLPFENDAIDADISMLRRIETISNDVRCILKMVDTYKGPKVNDRDTYIFDKKDEIEKFRTSPGKIAEANELKLDLRQLMLIKKANDIGTERVMLQTIIGIDGDVTTRIAQAFANQPITFINDMHHEAIGISVRFWQNLVKVVVKLGKSLIKNLTT